jgi:hypothetical protein
VTSGGIPSSSSSTFDVDLVARVERLPADALARGGEVDDGERPGRQEADDRAGAVAGDGDPAWFGRELDAPADLEGRGVDGEELVIGDAGDQQGRAVGGQREAVRLGEREFARDRQAGARGVAVGGTIGDEDGCLAVADDLTEARVQGDAGPRGAVGAAADHESGAALDHQQAVCVGEERASVAAPMRARRRRGERSGRRGLEEVVAIAAAAGGRLTDADRGEERERGDDERRGAAHDWQSTREGGEIVPG